MCWFCDNPAWVNAVRESAARDNTARENATRERDRLVAEYLTQILGRIDETGWVVQSVGAEDPRPPWAYTAGLTRHGLPELVVTGLDAHPSARLLNAVAAESLEAGPLQPGQVLTARGLPPIEVVALAEPSAHLSLAITLYGPDVRALQLVYADEEGAYPWSSSYRGGLGGQPVLGVRGDG
jgi:hypothetical protein